MTMEKNEWHRSALLTMGYLAVLLPEVEKQAGDGLG